MELSHVCARLPSTTLFLIILSCLAVGMLARSLLGIGEESEATPLIEQRESA